jgi:hypothetical protein
MINAVGTNDKCGVLALNTVGITVDTSPLLLVPPGGTTISSEQVGR